MFFCFFSLSVCSECSPRVLGQVLKLVGGSLLLFIIGSCISSVLNLRFHNTGEAHRAVYAQANKPGPSTLPLRSRPAAVASSLKLTVVTGCRWGEGGGVKGMGEGNHPGTSLQLSGLRPACILLSYQLHRSDASISTVASVGEHNLTSDRCNVD